jgi:hypothetical protein
MSQTSTPIFVVGVPRSGTTLLAAMLGAHSRLSCGPETHYFSKGLRRRFAAWPLRRSWPGRAAAELFGTVTNRRPLPEEYGLDKSQVTASLGRRPWSAVAALEALTETFMHNAGKQRWVEKTPGHLLHAAEIRRHYPRAPILRLVRDPRDVALSILKAPWQFNSFLEALLFWQYMDARSSAYYAQDPYTHTLRYEDLLLDPAQELRKICAFIGEEYELGMLDTSESARQVNRTQEPWKEKVARPLDRARANVWVRELTEEQRLQAEALVGDGLRAYGYRADRSFSRYVAAFPMRALACYPDVIDTAVAQEIRFWPAQAGEAPEETIYVGQPDSDGWLGYDSRTRLVQTLAIARDVLKARWRGQPLRWLSGPDGETPAGRCTRLLSWVLPRRRSSAVHWQLGARQPIHAWL